MPSPLTQAGATVEPSEYSALAMDEHFTGLWTQRSPLRDAAVPYLYRKFYSASRFDSIIDGINREISAKLTDVRRPGSSQYNANTFPAIVSFYPWKYFQNGVQILRVLADGNDGNVYDATAGQKTTLFTKTAGAGRARFVTVGNTLYIADGVDAYKILRPSKVWLANTQYNTGDMILDSNGNIQVVQTTGTVSISEVAVVQSKLGLPTGPEHYFLAITFQSNVNWGSGTNVTFSGLTGYTALNGKTLATYVNNNYLTPQPNVAYFGAIINTLYGPTADTGTGSSTGNATGSGTSGGTQPAWQTTVGAITTDGQLSWMCFGSPFYFWQLPGPTQPPTLTINPAVRLWQANTQLSLWYSILDSNGNVETAINSSTGNYLTGASVPIWSTVAPNFSSPVGGQTIDDQVIWQNCGPILGWLPNTAFKTYQCIGDSNGNLQIVYGETGPSGATPPATWSSTVGSNTTDGGITWLCIGPGTILLSGPVAYCYGFHCIDGSVTTSSPVAVLNPTGAVLGKPGSYWAEVSGQIPQPHNQLDQVWIYRTAQGQPGAVPVFDQAYYLPTPGTTATFAIYDSIPDRALNPLIAAPQGDVNDPPPAGFTGPCLHDGAIWGFVNSIVYKSGGPDTVVGSGFTSFSPGDYWQIPEQVTKLYSVSVQNGGLLIIGQSNCYIIYGSGTAGNPYTQARLFMAGVGAMEAEEVCMRGSTLYFFTNHSKVSSFDPSNGELEIGFPIGDQFFKVTTGGGIQSQLYVPGHTYVTWHEQNSTDTGLYVADGNVGWFRWSPIAAPESGSLWSPRAQIVGGTSCVQSVETSPGSFQLLIGPASSGPILFRDDNVFADWYQGAYAGYPAWDVKGSIGLCETGEVAEIVHIALKSVAVGARPTVSLLLDEIAAGITVEGRTTAWDVLSLDDGRHEDPPNLAPSISIFSDRYRTSSTAITPKCENFQLKIDYGSQQVADEVLKFAVYGGTFKERRQQ